MSTFKNILLFLSAFIPMYFLIIVKILVEIINKNLTFNFLNSLVLISLIVVILLGVLGIRLEIYNKKQKSSKVEILSFKNITDQHFLGYFSLFVLFAITFDCDCYIVSCLLSSFCLRLPHRRDKYTHL